MSEMEWITTPESVPEEFRRCDIEVFTFPDAWLPEGLKVAIAPVTMIYMDSYEAVIGDITDYERPTRPFVMQSQWGVTEPIKDREQLIKASLKRAVELGYTHIYAIQCVNNRTIVRGCNVHGRSGL